MKLTHRATLAFGLLAAAAVCRGAATTTAETNAPPSAPAASAPSHAAPETEEPRLWLPIQPPAAPPEEPDYAALLESEERRDAGEPWDWEAFYADYIHGRFEIGTRYLSVRLEETTRGEPFHDSFVGSVTILKEHKENSLNRIFVQVHVTPYVGLGGSYDEFGVEAWDYGGTDGTAMLNGPLFYVVGRYPNESLLTPYAEIGVANYSVSFENSPSWGQAGNKAFVLDDTTGTYIGAGCGIAAYKGLCADLYIRYMNVDVKGGYYLNRELQEDIIFTTSHLAYGVGIKYDF